MGGEGDQFLGGGYSKARARAVARPQVDTFRPEAKHAHPPIQKGVSIKTGTPRRENNGKSTENHGNGTACCSNKGAP